MRRLTTLSLSLSITMSACTFAHDLSENFLKREIAIANVQYLTGTPESALYALKSLARLLESELNVAEMEVGANRLAYTYLRIGLLHEKLENLEQSKVYFDKALVAYKGRKIAINELKKVVMHIDNKRS